MSERKSAGQALGWAAGFTLAGWALWTLGRYEWLTVDWSDPLGWMAATDLEVAVAAVARLGGLAMVGWVGLSTVIYVAARTMGAGAGTLRWLSIGPLRRAVDAVLAGSLVLSSMAPAAAAIDPVPTTMIAESTTEGSASVDPAYVPIPAGMGHEDEPSQPEDPPPENEPAPSNDRLLVVAGPGDHLWKLAEDRVRQTLDRPVTDDEVAPYWVRVVEANRDRIRSGDPDLIFPGEDIVMPEVDLSD